MSTKDFFLERVLPNLKENKLGIYSFYFSDQYGKNKIDYDLFYNQLVNPDKKCHILFDDGTYEGEMGLYPEYNEYPIEQCFAPVWINFIEYINRNNKIDQFLS